MQFVSNQGRTVARPERRFHLLPLIYTDLLYTLLFIAVFVIWAGSEFLGPVRWSGQRQGEKRDRGSLFVGAVAGSSGVVLAFFCPFLLPAARIPWQAFAFFGGMVLVLIGMGWRWYAIRTLGNYFTASVIVQEQQPVIQHGPYKLIRHPSYSGVLLVILGIGFMIGNWASAIVITAGMLIGLTYRMAVEEKVLGQQIGEPYESYKRRTKRLIPYLF